MYSDNLNANLSTTYYILGKCCIVWEIKWRSSRVQDADSWQWIENWCLKEYLRISWWLLWTWQFEEIDGRKLNGQRADIWHRSFKNALCTKQSHLLRHLDVRWSNCQMQSNVQWKIIQSHINWQSTEKRWNNIVYHSMKLSAQYEAAIREANKLCNVSKKVQKVLLSLLHSLESEVCCSCTHVLGNGRGTKWP